MGLEINSIASAATSARLNVTEQAQRVVAEQRLSSAQDQQIAVGRSSPNVPTSTTFSPAIYAQAAQFQIYSQSGVLSSLIGAHGLSPPGTASPASDKTETITPVDSSAKGASLDTLA